MSSCLTFTFTSLSLGSSHALPGLWCMSPSKAVTPGVLRLSDLLQVAQVVVLLVLISVVNDLSGHHRVVRVGRVPHVLVSLDISVLAHRRMQVTLSFGDADKNPVFIADPLAATPVGVVLGAECGRPIATFLVRHFTPLVGTGTRAIHRALSLGMHACERDLAHWAVLGGLHASRIQRRRGRSISVGQRQ